VGLSRKHIIEGVDASLQRLDLEYVDLIYAHRPDRNTPIEETVRAFNHIINTGKAFYWGTSEWTAEEISTAWRYADKLGLIGPVMEQPQYNMLVRQKVEGEFERLYEEVGLGLTIFSPLKIGILTGKYNDGIAKDSRLGSSDNAFVQGMNKRVGDESWKKDIETVAKLEPVADKLGISQATLAMAWVLRNKNVSSAITGASRPEQIYSSVQALDAVPKLTVEVLKEIDDILENKPTPMRRRF
jgi:aryl-alcohol dehydrogenase-like predicted oxidoreductase